jgi:hypothetical protein
VSEIADAEEERAVFLERTFRVVDALAEYVAADVLPSVAESDASGNLMVRLVTAAEPRLLLRLREDASLTTAVLSKAHTQSEYVGELERALATLDAIIATLADDPVT